MKKFFLVLLAISITLPVFAIDGVFFGLGAEANANTREGVAAAGNFSFGMEVNRNLAVGLRTAFGNNFNLMSSFDNTGFIRYYFPIPLRGLYIQPEIGGSVFFEDGKLFSSFSGGLSAGFRIHANQNWFIEPYVRGGYPFIWGAGLSVGYTTRNHEKSEKAERAPRAARGGSDEGESDNE